jgi:hypothetical protein
VVDVNAELVKEVNVVVVENLRVKVVVKKNQLHEEKVEDVVAEKLVVVDAVRVVKRNQLVRVEDGLKNRLGGHPL